MKTIHSIAAFAISAVLSSNVYAGHHDRGHYNPPRHLKTSHHHHPSNWVVPLVVGGVLGYALSEPRRENVMYVQTAPVVYTPQPVYREQWVYFSDCDCQRKVLVRVP
jgi:hypothetical protein